MIIVVFLTVARQTTMPERLKRETHADCLEVSVALCVNFLPLCGLVLVLKEARHQANFHMLNLIKNLRGFHEEIIKLLN